MRFRFLMSGQHGDIELSPEDLAQPFLISPSEQHPFLTLGDYFGGLQQFIQPAESSAFRAILEKQFSVKSSNISEIVLRSEKHGAYYHIASIEVVTPARNVKFAIITALSEHAKKSLSEEFFILQDLATTAPEYLPKIFCRETVPWKSKSGTDEFLMVLVEWLDNYHEWHLSHDKESEQQRILLWDYDAGFRFLSDTESYTMVRQVACILTTYYDQSSFNQIYPWHHGAGDFVVKAEPGDLSVKLITARQYEPLVHFNQDAEADQLVATLHFLLNLSLRVRLDRLDGVGDPAWLGEFAVKAALTGFFDGLAAARENEKLFIGPAENFLELLGSFSAEEICGMYESLLAVYIEEDQKDFLLIQDKLEIHAKELHEAIEGFSL